MQRRVTPSVCRTLLFSGTAAWALAAPASAQSFRDIYSFCRLDHCTDGSGTYYNALLLGDSGVLYGVTGYGGDAGWGTVFEMIPDSKRRYKHKVLYEFCLGGGSCPDGYFPETGVIRDTAGNLYGTTRLGGDRIDGGEVFELVLGGAKPQLKILHSFCARKSCADGQSPYFGSLAYAGSATGAPYDGVTPLYGTTTYGGAHGDGTVFSLTPPGPGRHGWTETVLHSFCDDCTDGYWPLSVVPDSAGHLFGITSDGGANDAGVAFELTPAGGAWTETVLHSFCAKTNCTDGQEPSGPLSMDAAGNLFGVTEVGGANGDGTLYELVPAGTQSQLTVIHSFCSAANCADGEYPYGNLALDASGNIFGTADYGGNRSNNGTLYRAGSSGFDVLYSFCSLPACADGAFPLDGVIQDSSGKVFGMTNSGGAHGGGAVYEASP